MSQFPNENLSSKESGDFSSSSFNSNISNLTEDEDFCGLSTSTKYRKFDCSLRKRTSSQIASTSDNSESPISCSSISAVSDKTEGVQGASGLSKVLEYKALLEQVNRARLEYQTGEFLVGCVKESCKGMSSQVRAKVQNICANSAAQKHFKIKNRKGESINILGIPDELLDSSKKIELSPLEKIEFDKCMNKTVKRKIEEVKKQKEILIGKFLFGGQEQELPEVKMLGKVCKEYKKILQDLDNQVEKGMNLISDTSEIIFQLAQLKEKKGWEQLEATTYNLLCEKVVFLTMFVSKLKHQIDMKMYSDGQYSKALNNYVEKIKTLVENTRSELVGLQASLAKYEEMKKINHKYKTIVQDYSKVKIELLHVRQTLSVLSSDEPSPVTDRGHKIT